MSLGRERLAWRLDARAGWRRGAPDDRVRAAATLRLREVPGAGQPLVDDRGTFGGLADATGMAVAGDGTVYVLDAATPALLRHRPCEGWDRVACIVGFGREPGQVVDPHGIAVAPWGEVYVADTGNHRVQVIDVRGWRVTGVLGPLRRDDPDDASGPRLVPVTPGAAAADWWEPFDVAVCHDGRVVVSDRANGVLVRFDRRGRLRGVFDGAGDGFDPLTAPTHVAVDRHGRIYVVQDGVEAVTVLAPDGRPLERLRTTDAAGGRFCPGPVGVDDDGGVVVTDPTAGNLYVFGPPEQRRRRRPVVECRSRDVRAVACGSGGVYTAAGALPHVEALDPASRLDAVGTFTSTALDSTIHRCRWHRVVVRADVPSGTYLTVRTFTSDAPMPDDEVAALPTDRWSDAVLHDQRDGGDWDCLVRSPEGRYLWLRLELEGTGAASPHVKSVVLTYPRQTSTDYLPATYRRQPGGDDFVERFLGIFDRTLADLSVEVSDLARYVDPLATPAGEDGDPDFLPWLASWIGLSLDRHWPLASRRRLVAEAAWLFAHRGTVAGLRRHLEIYLGYAPRILEHFRLRRWLHAGDARLGDASRLWGDAIVNRLRLDVHAQLGSVQLVDTHDPLRDPFWVYAHRFTVFVPGTETDATRRHAIERVIELATPAHTLAELRLVEPRMRVGHTMVGLDSVVGAYPELAVEGVARLGYDSVLDGDDDADSKPGRYVLGSDRI